MSVKTLLSARAILETTRGSAGTPTRILYFEEGTHNQEISTILPRELRNSYFPNFRAYAGVERNGFEFSGDWTYNQAIWWLNLHLKAVAAGTGAGADKSWTFVPTASTDDIKSALIEYGYADGIGATQPAWSVPYVLGDELTVTWVKNDTVKFNSRLMSAKGATQISAFTGALSDVVTISALGTATQIWVDPTTIGTTLDPQVIDASFTMNNGFVYLDTLDNTGVAKDLKRPQPRQFSLDLTRYYANDNELDIFISKAERKIRIRTVGPVLGGSFYSITLDVYGVLDTYEKAEVDGLGVARLTYVPLYNATATADFSFVVVNADAAIT